MLGLAIAAALFDATLILVLARRPVAPFLTMIGYGLTVFTAEAGVDVGVGAGTFSPFKVIPLLALAAGVVALTRRPATVKLGGPVKWFAAYVAWQAVCSIFAASPVLSLLRAGQAAIPLVVVFVAVRRRMSPMWFLGGLLAACAAHVLWTLASGDMVGASGGQRLVGLLIADTFALVCGLCVAICLGLWQSRLIPRGLGLGALILAGIAGYATFLTVGRTTTVALGVAMAGAALFARRQAGGRRLVLWGVLTVAAVVLVRRFAAFFAWFSTGNDNLDTLTGRTDVWRIIVTDLISHSPIVGYGPGAMRFPSPEITAALGRYATLGTAHNSFFEALLNSGIPGALLWLGAMISLFAYAVRLADARRPLAVVLTVFLGVGSLTGAAMAGFGIGWYALMATLALVTAPAAEDRVEPTRNLAQEVSTLPAVRIAESVPAGQAADLARSL